MTSESQPSETHTHTLTSVDGGMPWADRGCWGSVTPGTVRGAEAAGGALGLWDGRQPRLSLSTGMRRFPASSVERSDAGSHHVRWSRSSSGVTGVRRKPGKRDGSIKQPTNAANLPENFDVSIFPEPNPRPPVPSEICVGGVQTLQTALHKYSGATRPPANRTEVNLIKSTQHALCSNILPLAPLLLLLPLPLPRSLFHSPSFSLFCLLANVETHTDTHTPSLHPTLSLCSSALLVGFPLLPHFPPCCRRS